jgi:hypothetical protein
MAFQDIDGTSYEALAHTSGVPLSSVTRMMDGVDLDEACADAEQKYNANHLVQSMANYLDSIFELDSDDEEDADAVHAFKKLRRFEDR